MRTHHSVTYAAILAAALLVRHSRAVPAKARSRVASSFVGLRAAVLASRSSSCLHSSGCGPRTSSPPPPPTSGRLAAWEITSPTRRSPCHLRRRSHALLAATLTAAPTFVFASIPSTALARSVRWHASKAWRAKTTATHPPRRTRQTSRDPTPSCTAPSSAWCSSPWDAGRGTRGVPPAI